MSRWPEHSETKLPEDPATRSGKIKAKYDSDLSEYTPSISSPVKTRRKLSLLEEKRAIFQQRFFDTKSEDTTCSDEPVINVNARGELSSSNESLQQREKEKQKKVRHISVRLFDTFDNTFDEEDLAEDYNGTASNYRRSYTAMAPTLGAMDLEVR